MNRRIRRQIARKPAVLGAVSCSDTTLWRWEKLGKFPKRINLGDRSVGWFQDEIDEWMQQRAEARDE